MSISGARWPVVVGATLLVMVGAPTPVDAAQPMSGSVTVVQGVDALSNASSSDPAHTVEPDEGGDDGPGPAPIIGGLVILGAVFAMGLSAIRRQRAEGRRSKLPPIG